METDNDELTAQIKAQVEEWSSNSNESFTIDLVRGDGTRAASFQPEFTYPIFGEEEAIFGYQDLSIHLAFAAHTLKPHLSVSYGQKFKAQGEVKPTDIHEALREFLPPVAFSSEEVEDALRDEQAAEFTPPGETIHEYSSGGQKYEVWCASLADSTAKQLLENMQVLMPMFIEGGSMLQLEQDWTTQRWKLFLLYQVTPKPSSDPTYSPYCLIGCATSYRVFTFPDRQNPLQSDLDMFTPSTQSLADFLPPPETGIPNDFAPTAMPADMKSPLDLPSRERLSQFLILPPFQNGGHGQELYNTLYTYLTQPTNVREFTVEDPNEAFDDLRDLCDLLYLRAHVPDFASLRINTAIPPEALTSTSPIPTDLIVSSAVREKIRLETKIMPRQLDRLIEMHTLSFIPPLNRSRNRITRKEKTTGEMDKAYYFWRLYVKQRLFIFNRDQLAQVEGNERVEKLESALDSVLEAYGKCIERVEAREKEVGGGTSRVNGDGAVEGASGSDVGPAAVPRVRLGKRKIVADESDEVEEGADEAMDVEGEEERIVAVNGHKKVRVE